MRLICPNCGAQYEVPDDVIPDAGRDVQCSNCGDTWFQHHPDNDPELTDELNRLDDLEPAFDSIHETELDIEPEPAPPPKPAAPVRRQLDPSISDVLRQEAELETKARAFDNKPHLESQPDLGLEEQPQNEAGRQAQQARQRMARIRGLPDDPVEPDDTLRQDSSASRRDLLPDIDEINSSLRAATDRRPASADDHTVPGDTPVFQTASSRGGFRRGFFLALLLIALLWCLYLFAPQISAQVPAVEPILTSYVAVIDQARTVLDAKVQLLLKKLDELAAS